MSYRKNQKIQKWDVALGFFIGVLVFAGIIYAPTPHEEIGYQEAIENNEENTVEEEELLSREEFVEKSRTNELSVIQLTEEFNRLIGYEEDLDYEEPLELDDEQQEIITSYLDGLLIQNRRYNRMFANVEEQYHADVENDALIAAIEYDLEDSPLFISEEESNIQIDYDWILSEYEHFLNDFHVNLVSYHEHIHDYGYNTEEGNTDVSIIHERLLLLENIMDGETDTDNYYWESERYTLSSLLLGYGTDKIAEFSNEQLNAMEEISNEYEDKYAIVMGEMIEHIEENEHSEDSIRIVNEWMNEEFSAYRDYLEESD